MLKINKNQLKEIVESLPDFYTYPNEEYHVPILDLSLAEFEDKQPRILDQKIVIFIKNWKSFCWEMKDALPAIFIE